MDPSQIIVTGPPLPDVLTFSELLNDHAIVVAKEQADKATLETIGTQNVMALKPKLVEWVMKGCPNVYPILNISVQPPTQCSDGEVRNLEEYILYCSGKTIHEHVALLQEKLPDISVEFANFSGTIAIVVTGPANRA